MRYTRDSSEWDELVAAGREILAELARDRREADYTAFAALLHERTKLPSLVFPQDRGTVGDLLADISELGREEHPELLLSVLVHARATGAPGEGFYALARHHGLLAEGAGDAEKYRLLDKQVKGLRAHYSPLRRRTDAGRP